MSAPGANPPCHLLHGWAMNGAVWSGLGAALARRRRVETPDLPGHGHAPPPIADGTGEALVRPLESRIDGPVDLVGWSLGGLVAMSLVLRRPAIGHRLVLIASSPCFVARPGWTCALPSATLDAFAGRLATDARETIASFLALQFLGSPRSADARRRLVAALADRPPATPEGLRAGLNMLRATDLRARLAELTVPVLVIQGDQDRIVPPRAAEALVDALPDARLERIGGAGHAPFMSHADTVAAMIGDFLA